MNLTNINSAYVVLIQEDNTLLTTQKRRVMQRSKLVDDMLFLVNPNYNGHDMSGFTVLLEYILPVSRRYRCEFLTLSDELYNGHLVYALPFDTCLTEEAGDIELTVSFANVSLDENGGNIQRVRKVSGTSIKICPITAWSDVIPDSVLTALDQRIIKTDAQIRALNDMNNTLYETKADGLIYDETSNELQLAAVGRAIGNKVTLNTSYESFKDGVPVVDFTTISGGADTPSEDDNIVEF